MPLWALFFGVATTNELGALLSEPQNIERLIRRIEQLREDKTTTHRGGEDGAR
jgi:hypothetical protein